MQGALVILSVAKNLAFAQRSEIRGWCLIEPRIPPPLGLHPGYPSYRLNATGYQAQGS